jgi:hypothetical protein
MKPIRGLLWIKDQRSLQIILTAAEGGIPLMHQLKNLLHKEFPGMVLEPLCHCDIDDFIQPKSAMRFPLY